MFTNLSKIKNNKKLVETCQDLLSSQRDGFGYAMSTVEGIAGQRTRDIEGFKFDQGNSTRLFPWSVDNAEVCNSFGNVKAKMSSGGAVFHGRISTNSKELINVHPLTYDNKTYLIHNGVVTNQGPKHEMITSNDTEHLLHYMVRGKGIHDLAENITGYYAIGMLSQNGELVIARDSIAPLFSAWLPKLGTFMFATTEDLIEDFCEAYSLEQPVCESMASDTYLKFKGNELVEMKSFKSRGYGYEESKFSGLSLGYKLDQDEASVYGEIESDVQGYLKFVDANIDANCYIELNKTQLWLQDYNKLSDTLKEQCDIFNIHGECLLDLYVEKTRRENAA